MNHRNHRSTAAKIVALLATGVALSAFSSPAAAQEPPAPVVSAEWLAGRLTDASLVVLHVGDADGYAAEHIPGARLVSLDDLSAPRSSDRTAPALEMPDPSALRATLEALGVSDGTTVVLYTADGELTRATRALFTLRHFGFGERVRLLDGGMPTWKAAGNAVTDQATAPRAGRLSSLTPARLVVDEAFVLAHRNAPGFKVVDARATAFFDGTRRGGSRNGHIEGAVSVPFSEITDGNRRVKSRAELETLFRAAGVQPGDTVIAYCHIGQQATAALLGATLLGHPVLLYDGSFNQWSRRDDLPVKNPAASGG